MTHFKLSIGNTSKEGREAAVEFARELYRAVPVNHAGGQAFKNQFITSLFDMSERCRRAALATISGDDGLYKPVQGDPVPTPEESSCCDSCCH